MKIKDVMEVIEFDNKNSGFIVSFEWKEGRILRSDYFPDKRGGEPLIQTEDEAWDLASKFANKRKGLAVNFIVRYSDFSPVGGYKEKRIENR